MLRELDHADSHNKDGRFARIKEATKGEGRNAFGYLCARRTGAGNITSYGLREIG